MTALTLTLVHARTLLDPASFQRLVRNIRREPEIPADLVERVADQTLAFLGACMANPKERLVPSKLVDCGWHAFILDTRAYAAFFREAGLPFIHHVPNDDVGSSARYSDTRARTLAAVEAAGYVVDLDLWPPGAGASCADEGNCSASGKDGDENQGSRIPK